MRPAPSRPPRLGWESDEMPRLRTPCNKGNITPTAKALVAQSTLLLALPRTRRLPNTNSST
eukprot:11573680-Alexandrium_andersonii.AAC.1